MPRVSAADSIARTYAPSAFKADQLKAPRVKAAYQEKNKLLETLYAEKKLDVASLALYLRVFKQEKKIEVWAKDKNRPDYLLLKTYDFCQTSGKPGPKRREGDKQIPEGFYRIVGFNPDSQFHLSLKVNYPNRADEILGDSSNLGGDIFIHGDCVTTGCIPITDDKIKELYLMAIDAKAAGQARIPVSMFPAQMSDENFAALKKAHTGQSRLINFWQSLKAGYDFFNECRKLPNITITEKGDYVCQSGC
ncbi:MAG: hypothetical protein HC913_16030 [Microscillaceae bacterium]|nr:hypothetical protein [Microscillaceae bacterium]